ncbi:MAG TPA: sulfatase-like hydrolase/transferase [Armatimonadaceae bacterium]|nr:sulfatase-like hydrolase/transferase [Armatimonadaceae bacterium]
MAKLCIPHPRLSAAAAATASFLGAATPGIARAQTPAPGAGAAKRPNIIYILADDLGYGDLSCFGQTRFTTPNLDRMAAEGTRLTHHYAPSPVCVPTRAGFMLGQHTGHLPVRDHQFDRAIPDTHTVASVLKQAGYRTMVVGKWGIGGKAPEGFPAHPQKRGFDAFYGLLTHGAGHVHYPDPQHKLFDGTRDATAEVRDAYSTDLYTAKAKQWISEQARTRPGQPFFLYLAYIAPHTALDVPDGPYPAGGGVSGGVRWPLATHPAKKNTWIDPAVANATYDHDGDAKTPPAPWTEQMKRYATKVRRLDAAAADLLQTLRDLKIDRDTLVVFTSDNGPAFVGQLRAKQLGSWGPLDGFKRDLSEGGIREPTLVWWPGTVKAGAVSARPSAQYDWLATFAELAGVAAPAATDGRSLAPSLTGRGVDRPHDYLYWEFHGPSARPEDREVLARRGYKNVPRGPNANGAGGDPWGEQQAVRIENLVGLRARIAGPEDPLRLYDVVADPRQARDLSADPKHAATLARMRSLLLTARRPQPGNPRPYDDAPLPAVDTSPADAAPGLRRRAFRGAWPWSPDTRALTPDAESADADASLDVAAALGGKPGAVEFSGYLAVPAAGRYELSLEGGGTADVHLWVHDAHVLDSEADRAAAAKPRADTVALAKGLHPLRILVHAADGASASAAPPLRLAWKKPGATTSEPVPAGALLRRK